MVYMYITCILGTIAKQVNWSEVYCRISCKTKFEGGIIHGQTISMNLTWMLSFLVKSCHWQQLTRRRWHQWAMGKSVPILRLGRSRQLWCHPRTRRWHQWMRKIVNGLSVTKSLKVIVILCGVCYRVFYWVISVREEIMRMLFTKLLSVINSSPCGQNGCHFRRHILLNENVWIAKISLKFVPKGPIDNNPVLVQIMAWRWIGDWPLSERMLSQFNDVYMRL